MNYAQIDENEVYSIKLVSGEEIIGKVVEKTRSSIWIRKPLVMIHSPEGVGFMNYVVTSEDEIYCFDKNHLILVAKTANNISKIYYENTTNIQLIK